ncbi:MAG: hypothetical protein HFJ01_00485 [Lachnospiraceae bacterium]|jgi:hypothetical protein|nr:hypothetical protein [Lachnospiraceae bacterium]
MSNNQNRGNMGEQIKEALAQALRTGDFKNLNDLVTQTVTSTLNEVGIHIPFENESRPGDNSGNYSGDYSNGHTYGHSHDSSRRYTANGQSGTCTWDQKAQQAQQAYREREEQRRLKQQQQWQEQMQRTRANILQKKEQFLQHKDQFLHPKAPGSPAPGQVRTVPFVKFNKVGGVSNILYKVFGGIGLAATGIILLTQLILWGANFPVNGAGFVSTFLFTVFFLGMIRFGIGQGKRIKRAQRYIQLCDRKMYIGTQALAESTGKSKRYVLRDLQKMLKVGMFPEGHLDKQKTHFMLSDSIYRQYLETEENQRRMEADAQREARQANLAAGSAGADTAQRGGYHASPDTLTPDKKSASQKDSPSFHDSGSKNAELNTMIAEGTECIHKLRCLNAQIPGEVISDKLLRLENLLKEIFDNLKDHPDQMHRMHKLMDYYLPTTLKLVEAYADFDKVSVPGEEITAAKAEIENTLDTINRAFTELLNNLFQDAVLDATTDAQVLKTMLAREGLTNEMDITHSAKNGQ